MLACVYCCIVEYHVDVYLTLSFIHSLQQLNFYAFRKIKYADTIRIDPKLEAETANYWRFRHEKFQRGKPELLQEIKRMNGQKGGATTNQSTKKTSTTTPVTLDKENSALKSEVSQLKTKLELMTKNIDDLTRMVQKVSLQQQQEPTPPPIAMNQNNKRTKVEDASMPPLPDITHSFTSRKMDVDEFAPPSIPSPVHPTLSTSETQSDLSDDTFVDQLFTAFKTENFDFVDEPQPSAPAPKMSTNRPRPELMTKLSDALEVLPTQIQELIVNRLVQAITAPKEIQDSLENNDNVVPQSPSENLPLAAATLAALLAQYGEDAIKAAADHAKDSHKALLIPVHA